MVTPVRHGLASSYSRLARAAAFGKTHYCGWLGRQRRPGGLLIRSWPTGSMAFWVMLMLLANLAFYYL